MYSFEVVIWTGAFGFEGYADFYISEGQCRIITFNGLTKKSVRNKAARYIRRLHRNNLGPTNEVSIYAYDTKTDELREMPVAEKSTAKDEKTVA